MICRMLFWTCLCVTGRRNKPFPSAMIFFIILWLFKLFGTFLVSVFINIYWTFNTEVQIDRNAALFYRKMQHSGESNTSRWGQQDRFKNTEWSNRRPFSLYQPVKHELMRPDNSLPTQRPLPVRVFTCSWSSWWPALLWTGDRAKSASCRCVCWRKMPWSADSFAPAAQKQR